MTTFRKWDIISLPEYPYKPFKIVGITNYINDNTVTITPIGKFENNSFMTVDYEEFILMGYVHFYIHIKSDKKYIFVPVMCDYNQYKYLVYEWIYKYEYVLVGEQ